MDYDLFVDGTQKQFRVYEGMWSSRYGLDYDGSDRER